ncbi:hypothetical protein BDN70DRAFT_806684, partial [Pholiota conissans]
MQTKIDETEFRHNQLPYNSSETEKEAIDRFISECANYAILSHKWLRGAPGELTYDQWNKGSFLPESLGYKKLANFCRIVWRDYKLTLAWMDTICINKYSSSELDESIRSMYAWYERATVCTVYLSETQSISELPHDSWFTRGWTLQELLAPRRLKFYGYNWDKLERWGADDKARLFEFIEQATTISSRELQHVTRTPFSRRMQWAASREVTREEDMAYSLMGIFNVSISIAYGEGAERAFRRLLEEIL